MKLSLFAGATIALGMIGAPAVAAPMPAPGTAPESTSLIESVKWRYHRNCVWVNGGWYYGSPSKYIVCRPHRPHGRDWVWYQDGGRHGWYHKHRRVWHYNKW